MLVGSEPGLNGGAEKPDTNVHRIHVICTPRTGEEKPSKKKQFTFVVFDFRLDLYKIQKR